MRAKLFGSIAVILFSFFAIPCVARSKTPTIDGMKTKFRSDSSVTMTILIKTMIEPYSKEKAVINLGWISGNRDSYTQIDCQNKARTLRIFLSPSVGIISGHGDTGPHYEYFEGYHIELLYRQTNTGNSLLNSFERVGIIIPKPKRKQFILEKSITVFDTRYLVSFTTGDYWINSQAKPMHCVTVNRNFRTYVLGP